MFSNDEADQLLKLPKVIYRDGIIDLSSQRTRLTLISPETEEYSFIAEITLNKKIQFKISLHHQEHNTCIGLLRIDYKGRHTNPVTANNALPDRFKPYVGKEFDINEPHIHYYVAGYKPLAWALPLNVSGFCIPNVNSISDTVSAINSFAKEINITTTLAIQTSLV